MSKIYFKGKFRTVHQSGKGDFVNIKDPVTDTYKRRYLKGKGVYSKHRVGSGAGEYKCIQGPKRCVSLSRKLGRASYAKANKKDLPALLARCIMGQRGRCHLAAGLRAKPKSRRRVRVGGASRSRSRSPARKLKYE